MSKSFKQFCSRIARPGHINIDADATCNVPERYKTAVDSLVTIIGPKMDILDRISIPFIECVFDDDDSVEKTLDSETNNGDIPDEIIESLSTSLYFESFNNLTDDQQSIIKVLACYICIQN